MSDFDLFTLWDKLDYLIDLQCGYGHFKWFKWSLSGAGKTIILPPTITGSPRWYTEQTQDALALTRRMGKPTLFITFTCNTKWREITESLHPGDSPFDRPDICARVFKQKVDMALEEIVKKEIFGELIWFNWIIEWQKRKGLPHLHLLVCLKDVPRSPEEVDRIISAEIPDPANTRLFQAVMDHMVHGPCGQLDPKSPCMKLVN